MTYSPNLNYESSIMIEVIDLSAFIASLSQPVKILKIDVEGAEFRILRKLILEGTIQRVQHAFVETHEALCPEIPPGGVRVPALVGTQ